MSSLAENVRRVQERMAAAAHRAGRDPSEVTLVAISKTHPAETIAEALELGIRHFGENRVEEAAQKIPAVRSIVGRRSSALVWHMVGHVQSRKAQAAAASFDWVHSVDSVKLAGRLDRFALERDKTLNVLLEFNVSDEASKYGLRLKSEDIEGDEELVKLVGELLVLPRLNVSGLMTMAPIVEAAEQARPVFRALRDLRDQLAGRFPQRDWRHLSMGMSDDFEVAIEEGATMVRIGRAIFGERKTGHGHLHPPAVFAGAV
jgi:pyridoxal phosphate enzyme (YggS family)